MNKKAYMKPQMRAIEFKYRHFLCGSGGLKATKVGGNAFDGDIGSDEDYTGNIR